MEQEPLSGDVVPLKGHMRAHIGAALDLGVSYSRWVGIAKLSASRISRAARRRHIEPIDAGCAAARPRHTVQALEEISL
jgi:hypothetical protein